MSLLVLDVGNTTTTVGVYEERSSCATGVSSRSGGPPTRRGIPSQPARPVRGGSAQRVRSGVRQRRAVAGHGHPEGLKNYLGIDALKVTSALDLGISIAYSPKQEVGADRLVNAVAGKARYGAPLIVVDFGTAITLDILDDSGAYLGGTISPGLVTGMEALFGRTAKLPQVSLEPPESVIGHTTIGAIQSGILFGNAASWTVSSGGYGPS